MHIIMAFYFLGKRRIDQQSNYSNAKVMVGYVFVILSAVVVHNNEFTPF